MKQIIKMHFKVSKNIFQNVLLNLWHFFSCNIISLVPVLQLAVTHLAQFLQSSDIFRHYTDM